MKKILIALHLLATSLVFAANVAPQEQVELTEEQVQEIMHMQQLIQTHAQLFAQLFDQQLLQANPQRYKQFHNDVVNNSPFNAVRDYATSNFERSPNGCMQFVRKFLQTNETDKKIIDEAFVLFTICHAAAGMRLQKNIFSAYAKKLRQQKGKPNLVSQ